MEQKTLRLMEIKHEEQVCLAQKKRDKRQKKTTSQIQSYESWISSIDKNIPIMPAALKRKVFSIQNVLFCQVEEHCYRLAWEREAHIPEMTSVGREKKELEGGGGAAEDCQSSGDKYPSKGREGGEERKGEKEEKSEGWRGMTTDTERGGAHSLSLGDVDLESFKVCMWGQLGSEVDEQLLHF